MLIFFDTEFTDLSIDAKLVSIGLIDETGDHSFYAELSGTWHPRDLSCFTEQKVLPHLGDSSRRIPIDVLRLEMGDWLDSFNMPVQLATDSLSWDWSWIVDIFGMPGGKYWPMNMDHRPYLLTMNYLNLYDDFIQSVEAIFAAGGMRRHHALDDAKVNRLAWLAQAKCQKG